MTSLIDQFDVRFSLLAIFDQLPKFNDLTLQGL